MYQIRHSLIRSFIPSSTSAFSMHSLVLCSWTMLSCTSNLLVRLKFLTKLFNFSMLPYLLSLNKESLSFQIRFFSQSPSVLRPNSLQNLSYPRTTNFILFLNTSPGYSDFDNHAEEF